LKAYLEGLDAVTVPERGRQSMKNGQLLGQAAQEFDLFTTADQNLEYQQNVPALSLAIIVLVARTNRLEAYRPLVTRLRDAIEAARPGTVTRLTA
jgi:hypothetical protein